MPPEIFCRPRVPRLVIVAVWLLGFLVTLAFPYRASAAEVPLSEEDTEQQADAEDEEEPREGRSARYRDFRTARALGYAGLFVVGAGGVVGGIGGGAMLLGLLTMVATFEFEPGLTIAFYGLAATGVGASISGVGALVLATSVLGMTFSLDRMGADISYVGFGIAAFSGAVVAGIVGYNVAMGEGFVYGHAPLLIAAVLVPVGFSVQLAETNHAFKQYRKEHQVRVTPRLGPNEWGAAVVTTF